MKREDKIVLIGGGGNCHSVIDVIELEKKYEIIGIIDDNENLIGQEILGYKVIGNRTILAELFQSCKNVVVTIGFISPENNNTRKEFFNQLKKIGFSLPKIISPLAYISKHAFVDEGTIIMHHALVNSNAKIGKNCIINTKALVEHDVVVGDNCHISTGAILNGNVVVKNNTFFGSNAVSKQGIEVDEFVKAGSLVK
jgi:sugar O-acyltransferase (sialic acid O-acetyltransferase NeuD family)